MAQQVNNLPAMQQTQEMQVRFLGQEDSLEEEITAHSSILAWKIPWTEESGGLQFKGLQRVRHGWAHTHENKDSLAVQWLRHHASTAGAIGKNTT